MTKPQFYEEEERRVAAEIEGQQKDPGPPWVDPADTTTTQLVPLLCQGTGDKRGPYLLPILSRAQWNACKAMDDGQERKNGDGAPPELCTLEMTAYHHSESQPAKEKDSEILMEPCGQLGYTTSPAGPTPPIPSPPLYTGTLRWKDTPVARYGPDFALSSPSFPSYAAAVSLWHQAPVDALAAITQSVSTEDGEVVHKFAENAMMIPVSRPAAYANRCVPPVTPSLQRIRESPVLTSLLLSNIGTIDMYMRRRIFALHQAIDAQVDNLTPMLVVDRIHKPWSFLAALRPILSTLTKKRRQAIWDASLEQTQRRGSTVNIFIDRFGLNAAADVRLLPIFEQWCRGLKGIDMASLRQSASPWQIHLVGKKRVACVVGVYANVFALCVGENAIDGGGKRHCTATHLSPLQDVH